MEEKLINAQFDFMDACNELNSQINAQVNHGMEITPENCKEYIDFFATRLAKVNKKWETLKNTCEKL